MFLLSLVFERVSIEMHNINVMIEMSFEVIDACAHTARAAGMAQHVSSIKRPM